MQLRLVGYFAKTTAVPSGYPADDRVSEICSVSHCLTSAPRGWIDHWLHNELGFFQNPADARAVLTETTSPVSLFAYRLLPLKFEHGRVDDLQIADYPVEPLDTSFVTLGFDAVSRSVSSFFECSPLSCNNLSKTLRVNHFCLAESLAEAMIMAGRFSIEEPEPGPYYVLEVLREN